MSEKTTCSSCRHFDADDKGRPVNGEGQVVGLCQLTQPKVEERIHRKVAKGIEIDEDVCPECHHGVGLHVATNDDAMTWPPQPIGVQSQAQARDKVTVYPVRAEFNLMPGRLEFRSMLSHVLKKRNLCPYGNCVRVATHIKVSFVTDTLDKRIEIITVLTWVLENYATTIANPPVTTIIQRLKAITSEERELASLEPWEYQPLDDSPRKQRYKRPHCILTPAPSDFPESPTKKPRSSTDGSHQSAHVLFEASYKDHMKKVLELVGLDSNAASAKLKELQQLKMDMDYQDHQHYDNLAFFFAWHFPDVGNDQYLIHLSPRFTNVDEDLDVPSLRIQDAGSAQQRELWHQALVLRKYLTLLVIHKEYNPADLVKEWNTPGDSLCWFQ